MAVTGIGKGFKARPAFLAAVAATVRPLGRAMQGGFARGVVRVSAAQALRARASPEQPGFPLPSPTVERHNPRMTRATRRIPNAAFPFLLLVLAGCTRQEPDLPLQDELYGPEYSPNDFFLLGAGGQVVHATVGAEGLIGPNVNLGRYVEEQGEALRGVMFGKPVLVNVEETFAEGLWGTEPLRLRVSRHEEKLRVTGLVRGKITDIWIGPQEIAGTIGASGYDLTQQGRFYEGTMSSGGRIQQVTVQVPETFSSYGDAAFATALVMLLVS
jgi:hypothetical protein